MSNSSELSTRELLRSTHYGELMLGDLNIPCYVLENGMRVLSNRGITHALGMQHTGYKKGTPNGVLPRFLNNTFLAPYVSGELAAKIQNPIRFTALQTVNVSHPYGIEAHLLSDICEVWLKARDAGVLKTEKQLSVARKADSIMRCFAKVGVIALVDEATGYQNVRVKNNLSKVFSAFLNNDYVEWSRKFPTEFYRQIFRLNNWTVEDEDFKKRPQIIGRWTNDIVYSRLGPQVLEELRMRNPKNDKGYTPI